MKCPNCVTVDLSVTDRQGVEIDFCAQCRGVWLDRGELDKILERSSQEVRKFTRDFDDDDNDDFHRGRKKKGWLADIFD